MKQISLRSLIISGEMTMMGALKKLNKSPVKTIFITGKKIYFSEHLLTEILEEI